MTQKATLKPYLEEIRQWVEQGRTDVWIAHTLNSTPASISAFRSSHGILRRDIASEARSAPPVIPPDAPPGRYRFTKGLGSLDRKQGGLRTAVFTVRPARS